MTRRRRLVVASALLLGLVAFLYLRVRIVATGAGGGCLVAVGMSREDVWRRCGRPCGSGDIPKTTNCGPNWVDLLCSSSCDVYGHTAACFGGGQVTELVDLPGRGLWSIPSCSW